MCIIPNVLQNIGYYTLLFNFGTVSLVTTVSYIWVIVKLKHRKKHMSSLTHNKAPNALSIDLKVTKAILLTLGAYLSFYIPTMVIGVMVDYVEVPYLIIVLAVCMLLYYTNNVINPFIYYFTLKDFQHGYKKLLSCDSAKDNENQTIKVAVVQY